MDKSTLQSFELSVLDQVTARTYIDILLCFPFDDTASRKVSAAATRQVRNGVYRTILRWPYLEGTLKIVDGPPIGKLKLEYQTLTSERLVQMLTVEYDYDFATYDELAGAGVQQTEVLANKLLPLVYSPNVENPKGWPVLGVKATFIHGGLFLGFRVSHSVMDGAGLTVFLEELSQNVRDAGQVGLPESGELSRAPSSISTSEFNRSIITAAALKHQNSYPNPTYFPWTQNPSSPDQFSGDPNSVSSHIFTFEASIVRYVRNETRLITDCSNISIWNTLAALVWVSITTARISQAPPWNPNTTSRFIFPTDARRYLNLEIPKDYLGNTVMLAIAECPALELPGRESDIRKITSLAKGSSGHAHIPSYNTNSMLETIAEAAYLIRDANKALIAPAAINERLAFLSSVSDVTKLGTELSLDGGPDVYVTSWADIGADTMWGIKGTSTSKPEFVRRLGAPRVAGYSVVLPRRGGLNVSENGEDAPFEVLVQLRRGCIMEAFVKLMHGLAR